MSESVREFLDRRERELLVELVPVEAHADAIRAELKEIRHARAGLMDGRQQIISETQRIVSETTLEFTPAEPTSDVGNVLPPHSNSAVTVLEQVAALWGAEQHRTIKQLVMEALEQHVPFRRYGATTGELRRYIHDQYDKVFEVTSLSPQLSRLKDEGAVEIREGKWRRLEPTKSHK
jgi:hypothetical protein